MLADELFNKRPEQLSVADFVALTNKIDGLLPLQKSDIKDAEEGER